MQSGNFSSHAKLQGYRLRDLKNGLYQIHRVGQAFEGTPAKIFSVAERFGIPRQELKMAVNELHKTRHQVADFGPMGYFLYTKPN